MEMKVRVLLFGPLRDAIGSPDVQVEVTTAPTVAAVLDALAAQAPAIAPAVRGTRLAVNGEFAFSQQIISENDECALIGLVSGG